MTVYSDTIYDKTVRWWICPLCDWRIITINSDFRYRLAERHVRMQHKSERVIYKECAMRGLRQGCISNKLPDKLLAKIVLNKL